MQNIEANCFLPSVTPVEKYIEEENRGRGPTVIFSKAIHHRKRKLRNKR